MKGRIAVAVLLGLVAGTTSATEQGTINQAGPYEATMQFYLHPAHGFPGKAEEMQPAAKVHGTDRKTGADAKPSETAPTLARARARKAG